MTHVGHTLPECSQVIGRWSCSRRFLQATLSAPYTVLYISSPNTSVEIVDYTSEWVELIILPLILRRRDTSERYLSYRVFNGERRHTTGHTNGYGCIYGPNFGLSAVCLLLEPFLYSQGTPYLGRTENKNKKTPNFMSHTKIVWLMIIFVQLLN